MEGQRQRSSGGRRRRRKARAQARSANPEPVLIAARRPNSPLLSKPLSRGQIAASASPQPDRDDGRPARKSSKREDGEAQPQRRSARIVAVSNEELDVAERERQRLLERLLIAEGRSSITNAARAYAEAGHEFPEEQEVQLRLLEHMDEDIAAEAIEVIARLVEDEPPIQKPVLEQRLRRLEEYAEDSSIREAAADLRRAIR